MTWPPRATVSFPADVGERAAPHCCWSTQASGNSHVRLVPGWWVAPAMPRQGLGTALLALPGLHPPGPAPGAQSGGTEMALSIDTRNCRVSCMMPSPFPHLGHGDVPLRCGEEAAKITGRKVLVKGRRMWPSELGEQNCPRGCQDPPGKPPAGEAWQGHGTWRASQGSWWGCAESRPCHWRGWGGGRHRTLRQLPYQDRGDSDPHLVQLG